MNRPQYYIFVVQGLVTESVIDGRERRGSCWTEMGLRGLLAGCLADLSMQCSGHWLETRMHRRSCLCLVVGQRDRVVCLASLWSSAGATREERIGVLYSSEITEGDNPLTTSRSKMERRGEGTMTVVSCLHRLEDGNGEDDGPPFGEREGRGFQKFFSQQWSERMAEAAGF